MKKLTVDGITFETSKEAKAAERELEAIEKIRGRMDVTNPIYAKVLYEKLIEKEMLHTKVGDKFLAELQGYFDQETAAKQAADAEPVREEIGGNTVETAEAVSTETAEAMSTETAEAMSTETAEAMSTETTEAVSTETAGVVSAETAGVAPAETANAMPAKAVDAAYGEGSPEYKEEIRAPYPEKAAKTGSEPDETAPYGHLWETGEPAAEEHAKKAGEPAAEEYSQEAGGGGVSTDTARLESILHGAIFDEKDLVPFEENAAGTGRTGADAISDEDLPDEYFGATGPDALVEESDEADLDAFMKEYGLTDIEDPDIRADGEGQTEEEEEKADEAELDELMREYGVTEAAGSENTAAAERPEEEIGAEEQPEEDEKISAGELDALVDEYTGSGAETTKADASEAPLDLNIEEKEESNRQEDGGFHLELDDADLYDEEPDDDRLLAEARMLKKELHQEDLSEVFSDREEQPEKKHFSLYGVLIVSLILNVVLIASMAIMVQVFKNSDNRNILNYERIIEQEYQTATPSDAE